MRRNRPWRRVPGWLPLVVVALAAVLSGALIPAPAAASPGPNLRQPLVAAPSSAPLRPGLRATIPSAQALATAVQQATGLTPAQVTAENVCPAPAPRLRRVRGPGAGAAL